MINYENMINNESLDKTEIYKFDKWLEKLSSTILQIQFKIVLK